MMDGEGTMALDNPLCHPARAITRRCTLTVAVFLAVPLSGCVLEETADEGAAGPEDLPQLVFLARGNEPFWNLRVFPDRLRYDALGQDPVEFNSPEHLSEPGTGIWTWSAEGDAGTISVTIEQRPCDDTMADVSYEYAASVRVGDRVVEGCAMKGGQENRRRSG